MYKILAVALAGLLLQTSHSWSQTVQTLDPIIVTATKLETPAKEVASSVTIVTEEEIQSKQHTSVLETLRDVPGVDVVRQGGPGQQTSVFIRGANSHHTLILIDGIELNDPSTPSRAFDFAHLTTDNIERIEILRGPNSTLYGSDALGGVINVITKRGQGSPRLTVSAEGGSYETYREKVELSGGSDLINYNLTASYLESNGIWSASHKDGNSERDGYDNLSVSSRIGLTPTDYFDIDFFLRYTKADTDIDAYPGPLGDDPNYTSAFESIALRTQAGLFLFDDLWEQKLGFSLTDYDRENDNKPDPLKPDDIDKSSYESTIYKIDWQNNLYLHKYNTLTLGLDYEKERANARSLGTFTSYGMPFSVDSEMGSKKTHTIGYFIQDQVKIWDSFFTTLGFRIDDHNKFGSEATYRITSTYLIEPTGTKLKATYGTGFKAPTIFQLYSPDYGNQDLKPEEVKGWDVGLEQTFFHGKSLVTFTYFENDFENLIDTAVNETTSVFEFLNIEEAKTKGIEITASLEPTKNTTLKLSYVYTEAKDEKEDERLVRRPRDKFSLDINQRFLDKGNINLNILYVGEREDKFFNEATFEGGRIDLSSYTLVNLAASYNVSERLRLFGRVDNLFDKEYVELWGYDTAGISGYAGAEYTF